MSKPYDTKLLLMVAQEPFDVDINRFCKLLPIAYLDGTGVRKGDFPNDGEIWWMLTARTGPLARPGSLLAGLVEDATQFDSGDPESSQYQANRDATSDLSMKDALEVIDLGDDEVGTIEDLASTAHDVILAFRPCPAVLIRWRAMVYGPFQVSSREDGSEGTRYRVSFLPHAANSSVLCSTAEVFSNAVPASHLVQIDREVSLSTQRLNRTTRTLRVCREVVLRPGFDAWAASDAERIKIESLEQILARVAKAALTRKKRRQFRELLGELELGQEKDSDGNDALSAIERAKHLTEAQDRFVVQAADALVRAGLLSQDGVHAAEKRAAQQYVEDNAASLQAEVSEEIAAIKQQLARLSDDHDALEGELERTRADRIASLESELGEKKAEFQRELEGQRQDLAAERSELESMSEVIETNLRGVVNELRDQGNSVVAKFLTIAPLIQAAGLIRSSKEHPASEPGPLNAGDPHPQIAPFVIPPGLTRRRSEDGSPLPEEEFFARFEDTVMRAGFTYRADDLRRFHISVKTGDLTVLGGPSGTGKSSLPLLYAAALRGDSSAQDRVDCAIVAVSPSWTDTRELLGFLNAIDGRFYPSESGLYQYLILAAEEARARGQQSSVYPILLDEMNLAQVEHYFGEFLSGLERRGSARAVSCFSPESASEHCPFRAWSRLELSPGIRFVGTVNFDETTRNLSDRVLDRVNLIRLGVAALPEGTHTPEVNPTASGREVTVRDVSRWTHDSALPRDIASFIDAVRPSLDAVGCPMSPRSYRALRRFVASAAPLLSPSAAIDYQLAQRVIPRLRPPVTEMGADALDALISQLHDNTISPFEETQRLLAELRQAASYGSWDYED